MKPESRMRAMKRPCVAPMLVLTIAIAAGCSDDSGPAADQGAAAEVGVDLGPDGTAADGPAVDGPPPDGLAPDGPVLFADSTAAPPDGTGDGAASQSFDLELTVGFSYFVPCDPADADKDCKGDLYLSVHDKPVSATSFGNPIFEKLEKNVASGTVVMASKVPLAPKLYLAAFLEADRPGQGRSGLPRSGALFRHAGSDRQAQAGLPDTAPLAGWRSPASRFGEISGAGGAYWAGCSGAAEVPSDGSSSGREIVPTI
jgi:hypothetical protein